MFIREDIEVATGIACPVCGSSVRRTLYCYKRKGEEGRIYDCRHCGFLFLHPVPLSDLTDRRMDTLEDAELFNNSLLKFLHEKLIVNREIAIVRKLVQKDRFSLLDIGCGTGWTSSIWQRVGAEVTGLEPSPRRAAVAKERHGLRILQSSIEELRSEKKYDVIVMRHVLEHIADPLPVLASIRGHLDEKGIAVIIVPNINCIGRYLFGARWTWVLPWHCDFFSPRSMRYLMKRSGFDVVKLYQMPSPLWYPQSFLRLIPGSERFSAGLYRTLSLASFLPFIPLVLLGYLTGQSDNITIIARREQGDGSC